MDCMNYYHNKKFGLLKFHSGYGKIYFNNPKGYSRKIINAQTDTKTFLALKVKEKHERQSKGQQL